MAISKIKAAIRSHHRRLDKGVDEETKQSISRKLDGLNYELNKVKEDELSRKMSSRYHKIKFIEKRKLFRLINSIKNNKINKNDTHPDSKRALFKYRQQLNYIINYPTNIKYISVLHSPSNSADTKSRQEKLDDVESKMNAGDISSTPELIVFKSLQSDNVNEVEGSKGSKQTPQTQESQKSQKSQKSHHHQPSEDSDDQANLSADDFFE
ncbi:hypothetical protein E3P96_03873 [Wallemia ichthyophaga]|nr:hypothetical protein E3P96_03873 [Wallemia ichthyophaga]